jgi:hypothetical protein
MRKRPRRVKIARLSLMDNFAAGSGRVRGDFGLWGNLCAESIGGHGTRSTRRRGDAEILRSATFPLVGLACAGLRPAKRGTPARTVYPLLISNVQAAIASAPRAPVSPC